jgi:hypothetical protein
MLKSCVSCEALDVFRHLAKTDRVPAEAPFNPIDDRRQALMPFILTK